MVRIHAVKCKHCGSDLDRLAPEVVSLQSCEIAGLLSDLVGRSLVMVDECNNRFRLLETVRQYSADRIREIGLENTVRDGHRNYFSALCQDSVSHLTGSDQAEWLKRLDTEHDNLRAALDWAFRDPKAGDSALSICASLRRFWYFHGHFAEGRKYCEIAISMSNARVRTPARANALMTAGLMAYYQGELRTARQLWEECLSICRETGDRKRMASVLLNLANVASMQGDFKSSEEAYMEALGLSRDSGNQDSEALALENLGRIALHKCDPAVACDLADQSLALQRLRRDNWGIARALAFLGEVAFFQEDYSEARRLLEESLTVRRDLGDRAGIAESLCTLGMVVREQGDTNRARDLLIEGLTVSREVGMRSIVANAMDGLAACSEEYAHAARIWGAAERLREEIGTQLYPEDLPRYNRDVAAAQRTLGEIAVFDWAWQHGRTMTMEQAVEYALSEATK
jgi:non-specific serine/threonine protein kinase